MATALDIITDSLNKLGVYSPGDTITDADAQRALSVFNDMLDSWSNESLSCYQGIETSVPLAVGQTSYTVGIGGQINIIRPLRIRMGAGAAYSQDTNGNNYYCEVVNRPKWNLINNRGSTITSNVPTTAFYDPSFPLATLNLYPTPNVGGFTFFFDSDLQLISSLSLSTTLSLPQGYKKALQDNLALEIQPYFSDAPLNEMMVRAAKKSKGNIKRTNMKVQEVVYDPELYSGSSSTYNIYTDT